MNFLEKLDTLMAQKGLNRKTLSEVSGVPYTTIIGFYAKGYEGTRMSTVKSLAHFFNVSTDYLIRDEITDPNYGLSAPADQVLAPDERQLVTDYRAFNEEGKEKVRDYVADLADNPKYKKCANSSLDQEA
ncbi:MAG: helix-turn-helix domain-containing protein [Agathobaculum desmolans]|uniref:helix-turn-helix domain-containing protein n=1 Tax=Agathobaculum desmolans TaxID=39484 RepID=UPI0039959100